MAKKKIKKKKKKTYRRSVQKKFVGRPTKYTKDMCDSLLNSAMNGEHISEFCADVGICRDTYYEWKEKQPAFSYTIKKANEIREAWWCKAGRIGITSGKEFNTGTFCFMMKNMFREDFKDRHDIELGKETLNEFKLGYSLEDEE